MIVTEKKRFSLLKLKMKTHVSLHSFDALRILLFSIRLPVSIDKWNIAVLSSIDVAYHLIMPTSISSHNRIRVVSIDCHIHMYIFHLIFIDTSLEIFVIFVLAFEANNRIPDVRERPGGF